MKRALGVLLLAACTSHGTTTSGGKLAAPASAAALLASAPQASWTQLDSKPYPGKQDDLFFVDDKVGYYGNGQGLVYRSDDGGQSWREVWKHPGTYVRALGFVDAQHGFVGNLGPGAFPGVSDETPLYETRDGGATWAAVTAIKGPLPRGICAIDVLHDKFINAGHLEDRTIIHAAGRVSGPSFLLSSTDGGATWTSRDVSAQAGMLLDVKFVDAMTGFRCAASSTDPQDTHARILKTTDGGATWKVVYDSPRPWEIGWKCSFPSKQVGYATIQSYDEDEKNVQRYIAKTSDGGETWHELPLAADHDLLEFGIGFVDEETGWVGAMDGIWQTTDGGAHWVKQAAGKAMNKIRTLRTPTGFVAWAIGNTLWKLTVEPAAE
jgi:photosystem II stability/assembly factor-like uncharacterized protein